MAHELEFQDGRASFFAVRDTAWHGEGIVLAEAPSFTEALALARLDYPVVKEQTFIADFDANGVQVGTKPSAVAFVTRRTDTGKELGSVGPQYEPVQNVDAFAPLIPLVDAGVLQLETGGVLRDGADAWLLAQFNIERFGPVVREVFTDEVAPFALIANNHSGRRNVTVAETPIRVVCANTLGMAEHDLNSGRSRSISVQHRGDATTRLVEAATTLFGAVIERYEVIAKQYRLLKGFYLDEQMFRELVIEPAIGRHPQYRAEFNPEARLAEATITRYEKRVEVIRNLWAGGKGHAGDGSAWEAYNGLVEAIDHDTELFPTRSGVYRCGQLMEGHLREKKQRTLNALVAAASE